MEKAKKGGVPWDRGPKREKGEMGRTVGFQSLFNVFNSNQRGLNIFKLNLNRISK
jgi:hypothetical protein